MAKRLVHQIKIEIFRKGYRSLTEFSETAGVSRGTLRTICKGVPVRKDTIQVIADALDMSFEKCKKICNG